MRGLIIIAITAFVLCGCSEAGDKEAAKVMVDNDPVVVMSQAGGPFKAKTATRVSIKRVAPISVPLLGIGGLLHGAAAHDDIMAKLNVMTAEQMAELKSIFDAQGAQAARDYVVGL